MKKTRKKILGIFSLVVVIVTTFLAVIIPGPDTSAITHENNSVFVHVVNGIPDVDIRDIVNEKVYVAPEENFTIDY